MSGLFDALARLFGSVVFWVVVLPWQQAIRVRCGRRVQVLRAGVYFKIPVLDVVRVESVRRRTSMLPVQTLSTADGHAVTVSAIVGYSIGDVELLYRALHHAEDTIIQTVQGVIAAEVFSRARGDLRPADLGALAGARVAEAFRPFGLIDIDVQLTDFAFVRAFRLISDQRWFHGGVLDTQDAARGRS